jgi:hypothetical protein
MSELCPEAPGVGTGAWTVAIEVSALHRGPHAVAEFVAFAVAALREAEDVDLIEWSVRPLRRRERGGQRLRRNARARLGERAARVGLPVRAGWASPAADVTLLASGPLALRANPPGVVAVLDLEVMDRSTRQRRQLDRLRRAAADGMVLLVSTNATADALSAVLHVERASIAVVAPGVRAARRSSAPRRAAEGAILVLEGTQPSRDLAVLEALQLAGAPAHLVGSPDAATEPTCCVLASPSDAFPLAALEAMAGGIAVVAARSPTTTELLDGAATLVDGGATRDLVEVAMGMHVNEQARGIARAAGSARAADFTWARRSGALQAVVRRTLAASCP